MRPSSHQRIATWIFVVFSAGLQPLSNAATNSPLVVIPPRALPTNGPPINYKDLSTLPPLPGAAAPTPIESPTTATNIAAAEGLGVITPPDTHGAVGTNDVVNMLNYGVGFQSRTGLTNQTQDLHVFWKTNTTPFDPRTVYDPYHHRWMATVVDEQGQTNSGVLLGISQTSNPTNAWYVQRFKADPNSQLWADSPTLGFNKDWIVVHVDLYTTGVAHFARSDFYVFNKTNAYAGNLTNYTFFTHNSSTNAGGEIPAATYDNTETNLYFIQRADGRQGKLRLYTINGPVNSPSLNGTNVPTYISKPNVFWSDTPPNIGRIAPQLGATNKISTGTDGRIQNVVFRNGYLWCVQTVYLPTNNPTRSLIQWWQLDPRDNAVKQCGQLDSGHAGVMYAFPSIAVNRFNDVLIGYSNFATNAYASGSYSFHAYYDQINTLRSGRLLKSGETAYTGSPRWGDYSATVVDPVNDSDFWTIQMYAKEAIAGRTWWGQIKVDLPSNDQFSAAVAISGTSGSITNTNRRATKETGEPNHAGHAGGASIWFNWTAPYDGLAAMTTLDSSSGGAFDTVLGIYTGSSVGSLTTIASDDDSAGYPADLVVFTAVSNTTYHVAVDGVNGRSGTVVLSWLQSHVPVILLQPEGTNVVANANESATFDVLAAGIPSPLRYQWQHQPTNSGAGWTNIANATNTSFTISNVQSNDAGGYRVAITNSSGAVTSVVATLFVHADSAARLSQFDYSTNGFRFHIYGLTNRAYAVETSTNLDSPTNWYRIFTNYVSFWYTNLSASNDPQRFYRAITNAAGP